MPKLYKTAMGKTIDIEGLKMANEETIAVGNMKVNARGDQLGPGGTVQRQRNEVIGEFYAAGNQVSLTPEERMAKQLEGGVNMRRRQKATQPTVNTESISREGTMEEQNKNQESQNENVEQEEELTEAPVDRRLRGSLAGSMAKEMTVNQERLADPRTKNKPKGPARIK